MPRGRRRHDSAPKRGQAAWLNAPTISDSAIIGLPATAKPPSAALPSRALIQ